LASIPVLHQLIFVQRRPLDHQRVSAARQRSVDGIQRGDVVLRLVLAVEGMKMRWGMIIPIHGIRISITTSKCRSLLVLDPGVGLPRGVATRQKSVRTRAITRFSVPLLPKPAHRIRCQIDGTWPGPQVKADRFARKVLRLVGEGQSYREISHRLGIRRNTLLSIVQPDRAARTES